MVGAAMAAVLGKSPLPGSGFAALTLTTGVHMPRTYVIYRPRTYHL